MREIAGIVFVFSLGVLFTVYLADLDCRDGHMGTPWNDWSCARNVEKDAE